MFSHKFTSCSCGSLASFHQSIPHASTDCGRRSHDLGILFVLIDENDESPGTIAQAVAEVSARSATPGN